MVGRYKYFNEEKGYGFITGEDGQDYFAHISEVKSIQLPYRGATAEFTPIQNDKGAAAVDIHVQAFDSRPRFIQIGEYRIKLSDIREYEIVREYKKGRKLVLENYSSKVFEVEYPVYCLYIYLHRACSPENWDFRFERESEDEIRELVQKLDSFTGSKKLMSDK